MLNMPFKSVRIDGYLDEQLNQSGQQQQPTESMDLDMIKYNDIEEFLLPELYTNPFLDLISNNSVA